MPSPGRPFTRFSLQLVRDPTVAYEHLPTLDRPGTVVDFLWRQVFSTLDREAFVVVYLDSASQLIGWSLPYVGRLDRAVVEPRGILVPALLCNAAGLIVAHNHPSGRCNPSPQDLTFSYQLAAAAKLLDIQLHDSLVIGEPNSPGGFPRFTRIDWPGKLVPNLLKIRFAIDAGLFTNSLDDEQRALSRAPMHHTICEAESVDQEPKGR